MVIFRLVSVQRAATLLGALFVSCALLYGLLTKHAILSPNYSRWRITPETPIDTSTEAIPNIFHVVFYLKEGQDKIKLDLFGFLSLYSIQLRNPGAEIWFHTNATQVTIQETYDMPQLSIPDLVEPTYPDGTMGKINDPEYHEYWTQAAIKGIPNLKLKQITKSFNPTPSGKELTLLAHVSDFARIDALYEHGGIYVDLDILVLKDMTPLRRAGFRNVIGEDLEVQNGVIIAAPRSTLMRAFLHYMDEAFNPSIYAYHSTALLHMLSRKLFKIPGEILLVNSQGFYPASWSALGSKLFSVEKTNLTEQANWDTSNVADFDYDTFEKDWRVPDPSDWYNGHRAEGGDFGIDTATSYTLHGYHSQIRFGMEVGDIKDLTESVPNKLAHGLTIDYILEGNSNFALAALPILQDAMAKGVIRRT